jgi:hypothetical protein
MASSTAPVDERRKQIIVAAADDAHLRMAFFSTLGAILDFQASWDEMDVATLGWLKFTTRWNRWWLPNVSALASIERHTNAPTDVHFAASADCIAPSDIDAFRCYLDTIEQHYRRDETISMNLFAPESGFEIRTPAASHKQQR